jgi:hypothetical protein
VVKEADEEERQQKRAETYRELIHTFKIGMVAELTAWMMEIEDEFLDNTKYDNGKAVTCSVFFWTCKRVQVRFQLLYKAVY